MPMPDKTQEKAIHAGSGAVAGTFEVSVIKGKIVLQALKEEGIELADVLIADETPEQETGDGLTVSAEIIAQAKGDKVVVFKKKRRANYRRKKAHRQQHTILRIVAVSDKYPVSEGIVPTQDPEAKRLRKTARSAAVSKVEEEAEFGELAVALEEAADRMGVSLNRAIESVRAALNPEREIAARNRFEAEFAGAGENWLQRLA